MAKATKIVLAMAIALDAAMLHASAQGNLFAQAEPSRDQLINRNNLAPTGETVPHPGQSQIGSESAQEKAAQKKSQKDTHSICSNCE
ncbi:MAG: hypothetical protein ACLPID_18450 [Beijerinckiaceae bacterium]